MRKSVFATNCRCPPSKHFILSNRKILGYNDFMITLTIDSKKIEFPLAVSGAQILQHFPKRDVPLIALKLNNELSPINSYILTNATAEPVYLDSKAGMEIYRRSLSFILAAAAHSLFPEKRLVIGHSLGAAYYYTFDDSPVSSTQIEQLKQEMLKIVQKDEEIKMRFMSYRDACELFENYGLKDSRQQLEYRCTQMILFNILGTYSDIYQGPCVEHTGLLKTFDLTAYDEGFLLRFPATPQSTEIPPFTDSPKIFEIYKKYKEWGKLVNVKTAADLNKLILNRQINDFIDITETFQSQNYASVAMQIKERKNVKVVLIAGPSSSGKTTSAKKLALHLKACGYTPKVISLDNYYVGREKNPKDENGNYDYECLEALDIPLLNQNLTDLFDGKEVQIPSYNFDLGQPFYTGETMTLGENDILIMEGIHALNDKLTPKVKNEYKFKIYISALTQLNINDHTRVASSDNRLLRRIVRDSKFRGKSAAATIGMWENVQKGERLHIFPYQNNADAVLNTALDYEIPVLKVYASPLLMAVKPEQPEYSEAVRLIRFLNNFDQIPEVYIPKQSIVREFIGGSSFHY